MFLRAFSRLCYGAAEYLLRIRCLHFTGGSVSTPVSFQLSSELGAPETFLLQLGWTTNHDAQDGWTVEIRRRLEGKAAAQLYKVWITPKGQQLWTKKLGYGLIWLMIGVRGHV